MQAPDTGPEAGFTLIELLVALAVFGMAVMAMLNVAGENTRTATAVSGRVMADIVAENEAVRTVIDPGTLSAGESAGGEDQGGRAWRWTRRVTGTSQPDMVRVDIAVTSQDGGGPLSSLTLFRSVR